MAVVRARTSPPYALITFVALWVVSTILAVLFYLQWNKASQESEDVRHRADRVYTQKDLNGVGERINGDVPDTSSRDSNTTLAKAETMINAFSKEIMGNPNASFGEVSKITADTLHDVNKDGVPLVTVIGQLNRDLKGKTSQLATAQADLDTLKSRIANSNAIDLQNLAQRETTIRTQTEQIRTLQGEIAKVNKEKEDALKDAQDLIDKAQADAEKTVRAGVLQIQELKGQIAAGEAAIKELQTRLNIIRNTGKSDVGEADGQIVRTNPALGEVYINLTSHDRLSPGLTFTIYDRRNGVHFGSDDEAKGKGSIEVVEPGEQVSRCRITHTEPGQSIQPGDLISNVVYNGNKGRTLHFVVYGDVDLDGDNKATMDEHDRLVRLIKQWGGVVNTEVTATTDYLVVGDEPQPIGTGDDSPTPGSPADMRNKQIEQYHHLVHQASTLSVPILNINRFLSMIGYYSTTVVRY